MAALDNPVEGNVVEHLQWLEVGSRDGKRVPVFLIHLALDVKENT